MARIRPVPSRIFTRHSRSDAAIWIAMNAAMSLEKLGGASILARMIRIHLKSVFER